jgi:hypothetical protein
MPSAIDITKPIYGTPTTQSVRDNFEVASNEITSLQDFVDSLLPKSGGVMTGPLTLYGPPLNNNEAASAKWTLDQIHSTVNSLIYVGDYDAAADLILTSGQPQFVVGTPLPAASSATSQHYFTAKTGSTTPIGNQPPGGVPQNSWLISNGVIWNTYIPSLQGVTAQSVPVSPPIANIAGDNVYTALTSIGTDFLMKSGGNITGRLTLAMGNDPQTNDEAVNQYYVNTRFFAMIANRIEEAPMPSILSYARQNGSWVSDPYFTSLGTNGHLRINTDFVTSNDIIGAKMDVDYWKIELGNATTSADFDILRYNDAGQVYDGGLPVFAISRSTGNIYVSHDLVLSPPVQSAGSIYGRGVNNPTNPIMDSLNIYARSGTIGPNYGAVIAIRGPTFPTPHSVEIVTGQATNKDFLFRYDGTLVTPGSIYIPQESAIALDYADDSKILRDGSGNLVIYGNRDWRYWFGNADGSWHWDGYPNYAPKMLLDGAGNLVVEGLISSKGAVYCSNVQAVNAIAARNGQSWFGAGGSGVAISMSPEWYWDWNGNNGTMTWNFCAPYYGYWIMRNDFWCYNNLGPVGGHGDFQNVSDERIKENIAPATIGLKEVLQLNPIRFNRIMKTKVSEDEEIGFSAQQVKAIISAAVRIAGFELPDGSGGIDSDNPTLSIGLTPIVVALVNAMKEMDSRMRAKGI